MYIGKNSHVGMDARVMSYLRLRRPNYMSFWLCSHNLPTYAILCRHTARMEATSMSLEDVQKNLTLTKIEQSAAEEAVKLIRTLAVFVVDRVS